MKKLKLLCLCLGVASSSTAYSETNLFAPKGDSVSKEDLNNVVQEKLEQQKSLLENNFRIEIDNISSAQSEQMNVILSKLEELQRNNEDIKSQQDMLNNRNSGFSNDNSIDNSYTIDQVEEELSVLVEEVVLDTSILTEEDTERLNKEFGENSLTFIGVVDDKKMYKNSDGEYIIKSLDFEYERSYEEEVESN